MPKILVKSEKSSGFLYAYKTIIQIGEKKFELANPEDFHLAMTKEESELLRDEIIQALNIDNDILEKNHIHNNDCCEGCFED